MALTNYIPVSNYRRAETVLNGRAERKLAHNTYLVDLREFDGCIGVKYHNTYIVKFYLDHAVLNTNGWDTYTTKERLNIFSPVWVYQKDWDWFVTDSQGNDHEYCDGMKVSYAGEVL